jgi:hypothetical protein
MAETTNTVPWITLQATDLNDYLVGAQATAVRTAALAPGQADTWTNVSTDVLNEIRGAIRGGSVKNRVPIVVSMTPLSIPPELKRTALVMIRNAMQGRIPSLKLTDDQKDEYKRALRLVERIQEGDATVAMPPDPLQPDTQQHGAPAQIIHSDHRQYKRKDLRWL